MKIGIMTFWWDGDNYGQILQCYALQKYLRDAGHDPYLIRYDPRNDYKKTKTPLYKKIIKAFNPVKLYRFLLYQYKKNKLKEQNNTRRFEEFINKYICKSEKVYHSYSDLKDNPPEADVYIVGSDQVWRTNLFCPVSEKAVNIIRAYLLDFGDQSIKRIAYAASFGKEQLDDFSISIFTHLLMKFDYISVREKSGIEICKKCGVENAELALDPTLLIDIDIYRSLYKDISKQKIKPYCFLYLVGIRHDFLIESIYKWARKINMEVIYVTANSQYNNKFSRNNATLPEWIYMIEHAEYIITNSYHCSIFSLFFKKKFGILSFEENNENNIGMNTRFNTLFQLFKTEQRFINDNNYSVLYKKIDWSLVSENLQKLRDECKLLEVINIFK